MKSPFSEGIQVFNRRIEGGESAKSAVLKEQQLNKDLDMSRVLEEIESKSAVSHPHDESAKREYSPVNP